MEKISQPRSSRMRRRGIVIPAALTALFAVLMLAVGCATQAPQNDQTWQLQVQSVKYYAYDTSDPTAPKFSDTPSWEQVFTEQTALDTDMWRFETNSEVPTWNDEAQAYTDSPDNVRVEPGVGLIIEAHRQEYQYPGDDKQYHLTSGRIDTLGSFDFEYGKLECTMKLPEGEGTWPACWLLSSNNVYTKDYSEELQASENFYTKDGEVDILEAYGNLPGIVESTVHTFNGMDETQKSLDTATSQFHTYGVEITPETITWTVDGEAYHVFTKPSDNPDDWPFTGGNKFYVILNLAMGSAGGDVPDQTTGK